MTPTTITHAITPLRFKDYLTTGDTYSLSPDEIAICDRNFAYDMVGELFLCEPAPRAMHTRNDPPLAFYTFLRAESEATRA